MDLVRGVTQGVLDSTITRFGKFKGGVEGVMFVEQLRRLHGRKEGSFKVGAHGLEVGGGLHHMPGGLPASAMCGRQQQPVERGGAG
jgi:hypothetical protein